MELIFFRHGATDGNREHRYIGSTDEPLSGECRELLKKNGTRERIQGLISSGISAIYTSPMERCRETAELLFPKERYPDLLRREIPDFRECEFGEFEGKTYKELLGHPAYQEFLRTGKIEKFPGGEAVAAFKERTKQAFLELSGEFSSAEPCSAVFVVHGGTIMTLFEAYAEPAKGYYDWQLKNLEGYRAVLSREPLRLTNVARTGEWWYNP